MNIGDIIKVGDSPDLRIIIEFGECPHCKNPKIFTILKDSKLKGNNTNDATCGKCSKEYIVPALLDCAAHGSGAQITLIKQTKILDISEILKKLNL